MNIKISDLRRVIREIAEETFGHESVGMTGSHDVSLAERAIEIAAQIPGHGQPGGNMDDLLNELMDSYPEETSVIHELEEAMWVLREECVDKAHTSHMADGDGRGVMYAGEESWNPEEAMPAHHEGIAQAEAHIREICEQLEGQQKYTENEPATDDQVY